MRRICTFVPALALTSTLAVRSTAGARAASGAAQRGDGLKDAPRTPNQVIMWNRFLLRLHGTPGVQPATIDPTRSLAMMHLAIADAVGAISGRFPPYRFRATAAAYASQHAATASAAHEVLTALYPRMKSSVDAELARSLLAVRNGSGRTAGIEIGSEAARTILRLRGVGSAATPFVLRRPDQFRPEPPPTITSDEYASCCAEVRSIGADNSLTRTPDQTDISRFWSAPTQNYWNEIGHTASLAHHDSVADDARLFALLSLSVADALIAVNDAKHAHRLWRPAAAIREDARLADAAWTPLLATPSVPSYPSSKSVISSAAATILARECGDRLDFTVTSVAAPALQRRFSSFSAAAQEAGLSGIYGGQHFRFDDDAGQRLGPKLADYVAARCYYAA